MSKATELHCFATPLRRDVSLICEGPSMTRTDMQDECDINRVMERFEKTGLLPQSDGRETAYLDVSDVPDLRTAMEVMKNAETAFMSLPASVRREFDNDPIRFVEFAEDTKNVDKMREWGLSPPAPVEEAPYKVEVVNPPSPDKGDKKGA